MAGDLKKVLALEGAEFGIRAICPGFVKTPLLEKQIEDLAKSNHVSEDEVINANFIYKHLIKQFITGESIAALAVFLASDHASIITGTCIPVVEAGVLNRKQPLNFMFQYV